MQNVDRREFVGMWRQGPRGNSLLSTQFCFFSPLNFVANIKLLWKIILKFWKASLKKCSFKEKQPIWETNWFQCMRLTWILIWTNYRRWGRRKGGEMPRYWMILRNYYNNLRGDKVLWLCLKNSSCPNTESWNVCVILWSLRFALKHFLVGEQVTKKTHKIRLAGWWMHKVHYAACRWSGLPKARSKAETLHQICFSFVPKAWLSCMKSIHCQMQKS